MNSIGSNEVQATLKGYSVHFSGIPQVKKTVLKAIAIQEGFIAHTRLTEKTDFAVIGSDVPDQTELQLANWGVEEMDENEFHQFIKTGERYSKVQNVNPLSSIVPSWLKNLLVIVGLPLLAVIVVLNVI